MVLIKWTYLGNKVAGEKKVAKEDKPSLLRSIKMERLCSKNQWKKVQIEKFSLLVSEVKNQCFFLRKWISNCVALLRSEEMFSLFFGNFDFNIWSYRTTTTLFSDICCCTIFPIFQCTGLEFGEKGWCFFYLVTKRILIFFFSNSKLRFQHIIFLLVVAFLQNNSL